jgi:hypothetical protein
VVLVLAIQGDERTLAVVEGETLRSTLLPRLQRRGLARRPGAPVPRGPALGSRALVHRERRAAVCGRVSRGRARRRTPWRCSTGARTRGRPRRLQCRPTRILRPCPRARERRRSALRPASDPRARRERRRRLRPRQRATRASPPCRLRRQRADTSSRSRRNVRTTVADFTSCHRHAAPGCRLKKSRKPGSEDGKTLRMLRDAEWQAAPHSCWACRPRTGSCRERAGRSGDSECPPEGAAPRSSRPGRFPRSEGCGRPCPSR